MLRFRVIRVGVFTVRTAVAVPFPVAVMVEVVSWAWTAVVILKVAVVAPEATVTDVGTEEAELLDVRVTANPPLGAAVLMVTVPTEPAGARTVVGLSERLETDCAAPRHGRSNPRSKARNLPGVAAHLRSAPFASAFFLSPLKDSSVSVERRARDASNFMNLVANGNFTN